MKKKVKCKCRRCGKTFVTTKADKIFMKHLTITLCKNCMYDFNDTLLENILERIFKGKNNEREQENG
jgi:hypothetical protein